MEPIWDYWFLFIKPTRALLLDSLSKAQSELNSLFILTINALSQNKENPQIFACIKCDFTMQWYVIRGKGYGEGGNRIMQFLFIQGDKDEMDLLPV